MHWLVWHLIWPEFWIQWWCHNHTAALTTNKWCIAWFWTIEYFNMILCRWVTHIFVVRMITVKAPVCHMYARCRTTALGHWNSWVCFLFLLSFMEKMTFYLHLNWILMFHLCPKTPQNKLNTLFSFWTFISVEGVQIMQCNQCLMVFKFNLKTPHRQSHPTC